MLEKYLSDTSFSSYEDFAERCRIHVPDYFNFAYDVVDQWAADDPDRLALVWEDVEGNSESFTFAQIKEQTDRTANLLASHSIGKGDTVMLILKRHYEYWFCLLALHKLGAIAIPATHLLTAKDIAYRSNAADVKMIIATNEDRVLSAVDEARPDSPTLAHRLVVRGQRDGWVDYTAAAQDAATQFSRPTGDQATTAGDLMLIYFTSGTTGLPKMVAHDFSYPLGHILTASFWQSVRDGGLHLTVADTGWAKAAWGKIYGQWLAGAPVMAYDMERFDPDELLDVIVRHKLVTFCAPPTIYRFLIKHDLSKFDLSSLQYCVTAGEPLNPEVYNRFLELTGHRIMEGFGQTETVVALATFPWIEPRPGSMGKPSPGYDIDLMNDEGKSCEVGEEGQIVVRTANGRPPGMFCGYHRDDELTASVWHDGVYHTGDMAWRDEDGYYWFVGRADDLIKSSGYRIGPFEVESALMEHATVMECAITGVPDPDRGAIVKATIVLAPGYEAGSGLVTELQEHVKKTTAPYKYPRVIEFVAELPKTISGKIRRVQIREEDVTQS